MKQPDKKTQAWIDARRRHNLSHAEVQMARELGFNPKKLGGLDNHRQEPWKLPLREFIRQLYFDRFGKERPDLVLTIEEKLSRDKQVKAQKRELKLQQRLRVEDPVTSQVSETDAQETIGTAAQH